MQPHFLSRDMIARNGIGASIRKDAPHRRQLCDADLIDSIERTLARRKNRDIWIFAYGSLLWNPTIKFQEQVVAHLSGWSRAFCISMPFGRGTPANPGLVLGLIPGRHCGGVAYRIEESEAAEELLLLWRREMFADAYMPRWVTVQAAGREIHAITFIANPRSEDYAGNLSTFQIARRLATARGGWGSSAEYLHRTSAALKDLGIADDSLETLRAAVFETNAQAA